ncbi:MAG: hypothetical protein GEU94_08800 [Micromonosporaceae bacterium]|nr:hypothetical protein [Micromonosporaceae bacterium]
MTIRHGYAAVWQGAEHEASPAPDGTVRLYASQATPGFDELRPGRWLRVAASEEIDQLRYVRTTGVWRGVACLVIGEHGDWLRVEYLGDDPAVAARLGLEQFDVAVYQGWAPRGEVADLAEQAI